MKRIIFGALAAALFSLSTLVDAAVLCGSPPVTFSSADVTFGNAEATQCFGLVAGTPTATQLGFDARTGYTDFSLLAGQIAPGATGAGSFLGIDFTVGVLPSSSGTDHGTWSLAWSGSGLSAPLDIVAVLQNSLGSWGSYLFSDLLTASSGAGSGTWEVNLSGVGSEVFPDLTNFWLFARGMEATPVPTPTPTPTPVPEPESLATTALALLALTFFVRRRRATGAR